jgi:hypothetical protein
MLKTEAASLKSALERINKRMDELAAGTTGE